MNQKEILLKLLEITENSQDSFQFLKLFRSYEPEKFAVIYTTPEAMAESAEALLYNLKYLFRLELLPVVVLDKRALSYTNLFYRKSLAENDKMQLPIKIHRAMSDFRQSVHSAMADKKIPFFILDHEQSDPMQYLGKICSELQTNKLILINSKGGIFDENGRRISLLDIRKGSLNQISKYDEELFESSKSIFHAQQNPRFSVAITSPVNILKELFTVKGNGSLIRKSSDIFFYDSTEKMDISRLTQLIEQSFRRKLRQDFWDMPKEGIFLEPNYKGCAIICPTEFGPFLSKFAVDEIARGEGVGGDIWNALHSKFPAFFWRSRKHNSISKWYMKQCTSLYKEGDWIFFAIGMLPGQFAAICSYLSSLEEDLQVASQ